MCYLSVWFDGLFVVLYRRARLNPRNLYVVSDKYSSNKNMDTTVEWIASHLYVIKYCLYRLAHYTSGDLVIYVNYS